MELLPDIMWWDVTNYLLNTPSPFTKEAIRNYKSTEAYDYFDNGHVQDVYMSNFAQDGFSFFKTQVLLKSSFFFNSMILEATVYVSDDKLMFFLI